MKELKVIQIIDSLNEGGAEVLAVNIANSLAERNIPSYLCATRVEGGLRKKISDNVGYLFLKRRKSFDLKALIKLIKFIKKEKISIVHAHSTSSFIAFCLKVCHPQVKIVWHDHYGDSEFLEQRPIKLLYAFSYFYEAIFVVNSNLKSWAELKLNCRNVYFLNNFAHFSENISKTKLQGVNGFRIVHVAGFRKQKDHLNLLKAFKLIIEKNSRFTLHLIGRDYKDNYSREIKNFIEKNNLTKAVFLYGACSDMQHILSQANMGVLSSLSEGLPISLLEYGLAKLPVVVTNVGECGNLIDENEYLVPPNDYRRLAEAICLLFEDVTICEKIRKKLYEKVDKVYSKNTVMSEMILLYEKILLA